MQAPNSSEPTKDPVQTARYSEIIEHMSRCCLCGNELKYHHETDYVMRTVREEAHCQSCGIRTRKESHSLQ